MWRPRLGSLINMTEVNKVGKVMGGGGLFSDIFFFFQSLNYVNGFCSWSLTECAWVQISQLSVGPNTALPTVNVSQHAVTNEAQIHARVSLHNAVCVSSYQDSGGGGGRGGGGGLAVTIHSVWRWHDSHRTASEHHNRCSVLFFLHHVHPQNR